MTHLNSKPALSIVLAATVFSLTAPANAQASLFERLGIAAPTGAVSQIMPQSVMPAVQLADLAAPVRTIARPDYNISLSNDAGFEHIDFNAVITARDSHASTRLSEPVRDSVFETATVKTPAPQVTAPAVTQITEVKTTPKTTSEPIGMKPQNHWTILLQRYVQSDGDLNRFDYAGLAKSARDMNLLDQYIQGLAAQKPSTMTRNEALAYWANLYNALTVQVVAQNWEVESIKDIKSGVFTAGPWKRELVIVEGRAMSLDDIEHGTMRATYDEPLIHYMVNCASIGCPNLKKTAWDASTLEREAADAARDFINSPRGAVVQKGKLTVSSIYKWFDEDFGGNDAGVIAHLNRYADADLKAQLRGISKVSKDQYDWDVNAK